MKDLFSSAALFYPTITGQNDPDRKMLIKELETLLNNSKFLSEGEKTKMRKVIPIFSDDIIEDLKQSLVRQNLRYLQQKMTDTK